MNTQAHDLARSGAPLPSPSAEPDSSRTSLDVRPIACRQKHALIFQRWATLQPGEYFVLVNDHDPVPLYYQFAGQFPGAFDWEYLVAGPDEFRVRITRLKATPETVRSPGLPPWPPHGNQPAAAAVATAAPRCEEVDARGLEPPGPMLCILQAMDAIPAGGVLRAHTDRRPLHLLSELETRGVRHECEEQSDGSWITTLRRG